MAVYFHFFMNNFPGKPLKKHGFRGIMGKVVDLVLRKGVTVYVFWLLPIFLRLPPRVRALKAAPDTAGHPLFYPRGTASPLEPCLKSKRTPTANRPINPNLKKEAPNPTPPFKNHEYMEFAFIYL